MKIISLLLCAIIPAAMSAAAQTTAQSASPSPSTDYVVARPWAPTHITDSGVSQPGYMNNMSITAVRDFVGRFKTASNPRWFKLKDGSCLVRFAEPGIEYRIGYSRKGKWIYTIREYHEKQLPHDIRHIVKSNYYDYSIMGITQVDQQNIDGPVYFIYQQDSTSYMTLRVHNGEMETEGKMEKARK